MERITGGMRQSSMMSTRGVRGIVGAGLLCAAVAGCGSVVASTPSSGQATVQAAPAVGCASVNQATLVTVHRTTSAAGPAHAAVKVTTQSKAALVRALFSDFCKVTAHPYAPSRPVDCPAAFGLAYTGTFYDGNRELAAFSYGASGCQTVHLTAAGQTKFQVIRGTVANAAPHLETDLAAVLGLPKSQLSSPAQQQVNPGGPMVSATS